MATENRGWSATQVAVAFVVGALAGAAVSWLLTTPSGQRRRDRVRAAVKGAAERAQGAGDDLRAALRRATDAARAAWDEARHEDDARA
jgi:gas vesicle protein